MTAGQIEELRIGRWLASTMDIRDAFAKEAMTGVLFGMLAQSDMSDPEDPEAWPDPEVVANRAYDLAEAMVHVKMERACVDDANVAFAIKCGVTEPDIEHPPYPPVFSAEFMAAVKERMGEE